MIIAIPMSRDRLATHFTKAAEIAFYDEQQLIARYGNPAVNGGCSAKKAMLNLIIEHKADIVIVQHIGERMLGKLLDAGISVSKADNSLDLAELICTAKDLNRRLVDASQGRASLNHEKKGGCCGGASGGCGCSTTPSAGHSLDSRLLKIPQKVSVNAQQGVVQYAGFRSIK
ncbi:NifB/NifX family molybdenum-iron cluster-binding protein [Shewanella sp. 0m-4]